FPPVCATSACRARSWAELARLSARKCCARTRSDAKSPRARYSRCWKPLTDATAVKKNRSMIVALALASSLLSGCTDTNEPLYQALTPGVPYPTTVNQVFQPYDPIALLTVVRKNGAMPQIVMVGRIHGWPFPHEDPSGDFGEGLFGYRVEAVASRRVPG